MFPSKRLIAKLARFFIVSKFCVLGKSVVNSIQKTPSAKIIRHFLFQNTFCPPTTRMELYPRRRHTEFYYEPQPMEEYQSRACEHPQDKLQHKPRSSKYELEPIAEQAPKLRINPPKNSDMRMFRNSYFS
ncbi:PREDICTED: uncharacterized protein LOC108367533 [Rhagoletis zephyria]|uniref:uncharacterized protein LOC108367533 n=1 Tax=Rhagoletis zephyria TaxID=28612 RepID=UPI0008118FD5|nr:PREDICTED: uncharacterized protein LOC108367533 [Rhagoletis zephyria]